MKCGSSQKHRVLVSQIFRYLIHNIMENRIKDYPDSLDTKYIDRYGSTLSMMLLISLDGLLTEKGEVFDGTAK